MKIRFLFPLLSVFCTATVAVESMGSIKDLVVTSKELSPGSYCVLDLDWTIMRPAPGHDAEEYIRDHINDYAPLINIMGQFTDMSQKNIEWALHCAFLTSDDHAVMPVEKDTISIINKLQESGIPILVVTQRLATPCVMAKTIRQLNNLGITLPELNGVFSMRGAQGPVAVRQSVIFCGRNPKSTVLSTYFISQHLLPSCVLYADDRWEHAQDVETVFKKRNMRMRALWYRFGACAQVVATNPQ